MPERSIPLPSPEGQPPRVLDKTLLSPSLTEDQTRGPASQQEARDQAGLCPREMLGLDSFLPLLMINVLS